VENVLGIVGKGHHIAFNILNIGRYKLGASDLGGCKVTINESVAYAMERHQFGQAISNFDSIKSKFANMIVRTFEQESILYRMVKDVDSSIESVKVDDKDYYNKIVAAIEEYAIEASMCKIVGSEALWLNADDGLQVFGGYGFTEDYPLAGIVRDTRVDRIFEGTNEINRQIVTGYFLKKALTEELPIREKIKEIKQLLNGEKPIIESDVLAEEKSAFEYGKAITLFLFNESIIKYGQGLKNEQQLMEILADCFTDIYIMDSVLRRITQNSKRDQDWLAIAKVSTALRVRRVVSAAKVALLSILDGDELEAALKNLTQLSKGTELRNNLFALKRQLAESLYDKGLYVW
jgi:alkylation response protein AidB-like acyl-CoA dehydrogenase